MDPRRYPPDWRAISRAIRARDGNRCACLGHCGDPHDDRCAAPNGVDIVRHADEPARWIRASERAHLDPGHRYVGRSIRVVLTVAHLDHGTTNNDPSSLAALCQRCHNKYDADQRKQNRSATRRGRRAVGDLPGITPREDHDHAE